MTTKGQLPAIRDHYTALVEKAYTYANAAACDGSSTAYGTYSTANHWTREGALANRRLTRALSLLVRLEIRRREQLAASWANLDGRRSAWASTV